MNKALSTFWILLNLSATVILQPAFSQDQSEIARTDLAAVRIFLNTIDLGPSLADKYGHVQIRVQNLNTRRDTSYSWGLYDFAKPGFALDFYKGRLDYMSGAFPTVYSLELYKKDGRTLWQNEIFLSDQQKIQFLESLEESVRPENRGYRYHFFSDNCSTRIRDLLDEALNGHIKAQTASIPSGKSYRDEVRSHQASAPYTGMLLEILANKLFDVKMTAWSEMFLPKAMQEHLLKIENPALGRSLLGPTEILVEGVKQRGQYKTDDLITKILFGLPVTLLTFLILFKGATFVRSQRGGRILFLTSQAIFWFFSGLMGILMTINWFFSGHPEAYANFNLLLFWPSDWVLLWGSFKILNAKERPAWTYQKRLKPYLFLKLGIMVLYFVLSFYVDQDLSRVGSNFLPCAFLAIWTFFKLGEAESITR